MRGRTIVLGFCLSLLVCLVGCGVVEENREKVSDLEFTVLRPEELPEELAKEIEARKKEPFQMSYKDDALYVVIGYGEKDSGGYDVVVREMYLGKTGIYVHTELVGPEKYERVEKGTSYPYVILKTEVRDEKITYQT